MVVCLIGFKSMTNPHKQGIGMFSSNESSFYIVVDIMIALHRIFEQEGVKLVVDDVSLKYLGGSTIDWVDSLAKSSFQIVSNPHAASSCGCHTSFTPKEEDY